MDHFKRDLIETTFDQLTKSQLVRDHHGYWLVFTFTVMVRYN